MKWFAKPCLKTKQQSRTTSGSDWPGFCSAFSYLLPFERASTSLEKFLVNFLEYPPIRLQFDTPQ
jgi:hypothetical protein